MVQLGPGAHHKSLKCKVVELLFCMDEAYEYLVGDESGLGILSTNRKLEQQWYLFENIKTILVPLNNEKWTTTGFIRLVSEPFEATMLEPEDPIVDVEVPMNQVNISLVELEYVPELL